jgi:DNA-binding response OmpR family regulator
MKILVVEDNEPVLDVIVDALLTMGHEPIGVMTGAAAHLALTQRPDLILLDLVLPDADGNVLRDEFVQAGQRVILMSGYAMLDEPFLHKPFGFAELKAAISVALEA